MLFNLCFIVKIHISHMRMYGCYLCIFIKGAEYIWEVEDNFLFVCLKAIFHDEYSSMSNIK